MHLRRNATERAARAACALALTLTLSACFLGTDNDAAEGIGFRQARFEEMKTIREYRACRAEGMELDKKALASGSAGTYLASAQVLEKCETGLGPGTTDSITREERMRAYALSVQNYLKGGDVTRARENFDRFRTAFPDHDLYYADGTSFISTMEALLGRQEPWTFGEFANLNVKDSVKSEMRRMHYWKDK
ncbi:MAG: hypothetical protein R3229_03015 [Alphaproteobacteria bacterium]|nr:hypothetical protein [Alphaproteobacteria bacterium]